MRKKNENCLEGLKCPKCGALEPFRILAKMVVQMYDDGSDSGLPWENIEWDDDAYCECCTCGYHQEVRDFEIES